MLSRRTVELHRRRRLALALTRVAGKRGLSNTTVADVCADARMARATFYALFGNAGKLMDFAFAECFRSLFGPLAELTPLGPWKEDVDRALGLFFDAVAADPLAAKLCLVHCHEVRGHTVGSDFEAAVELLTPVFAGGHTAVDEAGLPPRPSPLTEEALARMTASLVAQRLRQGRLGELASDRREMAVLAGIFFGEPLGKPRSRRR